MTWARSSEEHELAKHARLCSNCQRKGALMWFVPLKPFKSLLLARRSVAELVRWYNGEYRHSAIGFVTYTIDWHLALQSKTTNIETL